MGPPDKDAASRGKWLALAAALLGWMVTDHPIVGRSKEFAEFL